jgi:hypothetical protein
VWLYNHRTVCQLGSPRLPWICTRCAPGFILSSLSYHYCIISGLPSSRPSHFPFPPLTIYLLFHPNSQPCPLHIWHMATLGLTLAQPRTCTHPTTLRHNTPLLILQQPSLGSTSLPQALSHAPLAPPPARLRNSLERVSSTGRHSPAGVFGYAGSGYVRSFPFHYPSHG